MKSDKEIRAQIKKLPPQEKERLAALARAERVTLFSYLKYLHRGE